MKKFALRSACCALAICFGSAAALADPVAGTSVFTFGNLGGSNGAAFTSYSENGYTLANTGGQAFVAGNFGNPTPAIFFGSRYAGGNALNSFTLSAGGALFALNSFELATQGTTANYTITGFTGATQTYSYGGVAVSSGFSTFAGNGIDVDSVLFSFNSEATNLDNLTLTANADPTVPEPATWAMMVLGFGSVGFAMRRREKVSARIRFV